MNRKNILLITILLVISLLFIIFCLFLKQNNKNSNKIKDDYEVPYSDLSTTNWKQYFSVDGTLKVESEKVVYEIKLKVRDEQIFFEDLKMEGILPVKVSYTENGKQRNKRIVLKLENLKQESDTLYVFNGTYEEENIKFQKVSLSDGYLERNVTIKSASGVLWNK